MIKYISGDFPANTMLSVTITTATITWGLGKDNTVTLDHAMQSLTVSSQDEKVVIFSCTLLDGRKFEAQADPKTFEKLNRIYLVRATHPTAASPMSPPNVPCPKCGTMHQSNFCPNCGEAATAPHMTDIVAPPSQSDVTPAVKKKGGCLKPVLIVLCVMLVLGTVVNMFGKSDMDTPASASSNKPSSSSISQSASPPSSPSLDVEATKALALVLDKDIFQCLLNSESICTLLQDGITLVGNGQGTMLELYDLAKQAKSSQQSIWGSLGDLRDDNNRDYVNACQDYVINGQMMADDLIKYIDKQEMKYLSEAKQCIENIDNYVIIAVSKRMEYLISQGFTGDEAAVILSPEEPSSALS